MMALLWLACTRCVPTTVPPMSTPVTLETQHYSLEEAAELIWQPSLRPAWRDPTQEEIDRFESLIPALTWYAPQGEIPEELPAMAEQMGMHLERWEVAGQEHFVLYEDAASRRGAGAYFFAVGRPVSNSWLLLQAPHAYYDTGTGFLAASLYFSSPAGSSAPLAFFTNSLHRYTTSTGAREKSTLNYADACHNPQHLFHVATVASAETRRSATVVQLHGFGADPAESPTGTKMVISAGGNTKSMALSRSAAKAMQDRFGAEVLLFPDQVSVLGATTNIQAQELKVVPGARFLHVELSAAVRSELQSSPDSLTGFGETLFQQAQ